EEEQSPEAAVLSRFFSPKDGGKNKTRYGMDAGGLDPDSPMGLLRTGCFEGVGRAVERLNVAEAQEREDQIEAKADKEVDATRDALLVESDRDMLAYAGHALVPNPKVLSSMVSHHSAKHTQLH
ncbi:hypothetical protein KIPB_012801, partial [Kipferlia bialata]